jgi:choline kinase
MKAVILAAGKGTRIPEITKNDPKCLIKIGDNTLLERQVEVLTNNSIDDIIVVIGYKAEKVDKILKKFENVISILNKDYASTDNIFSLYLTKNEVKGKEFILLNGDTVFEDDLISKIVNYDDINIAPIDSEYYDLEELKIREENGLVKEILPKNTSLEKSNGSTIGIFKFSSEGSKILFDEIENLIINNVKNKWFEFALNNILKKIDMFKVDIHGLKWMEVDTLADFKKTVKIFGE